MMILLANVQLSVAIIIWSLWMTCERRRINNPKPKRKYPRMLDHNLEPLSNFYKILKGKKFNAILVEIDEFSFFEELTFYIFTKKILLSCKINQITIENLSKRIVFQEITYKK